MALLAPYISEVQLLRYLLGKDAAPANVTFHLYINNHNPDYPDTLASYTELSGALYTAPSISPNGWTVSTVNNVTAAVGAQFDININGACVIYGYYVTDDTNTKLLWAEYFSTGAPTFAGGGGILQLTPYLGLL